MEVQFLIENLTNPALLFFVLGLLAVKLKSDLEIPPNSSKFISLYLLFAIGFKGGQELSHAAINSEILWTIGFGLIISVLIPVYIFFILTKRLNPALSLAEFFEMFMENGIPYRSILRPTPPSSTNYIDS